MCPFVTTDVYCPDDDDDNVNDDDAAAAAVVADLSVGGKSPISRIISHDQKYEIIVLSGPTTCARIMHNPY